MGCNHEIAMCAMKDEVDASLLLNTTDKEAEDLLKELVFKGKVVTYGKDSYYFYVKRGYSNYSYLEVLISYVRALSDAIPSFEGICTTDENSDTDVYRGAHSQHLLDYYTETAFTFTFDGVEEGDA